jgi:hypothetical protein
MKTYFRTNPLKFRIKKRVLLINSVFFTVIISFLALSCIKEDYPVRLVFPVLTTVAASDITATTAVTGGNVSSEGSKAVTARGVCWNVSGNPSIFFADSTTVDGAGPGQFASTIEGLLANKTYHVRAYATNSEGTSYGQDISFKTTVP